MKISTAFALCAIFMSSVLAAPTPIPEEESQATTDSTEANLDASRTHPSYGSYGSYSHGSSYGYGYGNVDSENPASVGQNKGNPATLPGPPATPSTATGVPTPVTTAPIVKASSSSGSTATLGGVAGDVVSKPLVKVSSVPTAALGGVAGHVAAVPSPVKAFAGSQVGGHVVTVPFFKAPTGAIVGSVGAAGHVGRVVAKAHTKLNSTPSTPEGVDNDIPLVPNGAAHIPHVVRPAPDPQPEEAAPATVQNTGKAAMRVSVGAVEGPPPPSKLSSNTKLQKKIQEYLQQLAENKERKERKLMEQKAAAERERKAIMEKEKEAIAERYRQRKDEIKKAVKQAAVNLKKNNERDEARRLKKVKKVVRVVRKIRLHRGKGPESQ